MHGLKSRPDTLNAGACDADRHTHDHAALS
jgi:hypothetical protein